MTAKWTASFVFAENSSRLLPSYPLAYCQRLEPLIGTGDLSSKWLLSRGFSPLLGFNHAYRSCKWEPVFPTFLGKRLANVSLKRRRLLNDRLGALIAPPPPTRRFALQPAYCDEQHAEGANIGKIQTKLLVGWEHKVAERNQRNKGAQDYPSLPGRGQPPAPAIALGRKPVFLGARHARSFMGRERHRQ